jgi:hypothetical protein
MTSESIVFDALTVKRENTFQFDVWYANHYLRDAEEAGGCDVVRRYLSPIRGDYLAVFETSTAAASKVSAALNATHALVDSTERYVADSIGGRTAPRASKHILDADVLYPVFFCVPAEREQEFDAWYNDEHMAILLGSEYWPMCKRYRIRNPVEGGWTHIALHYLTDLRALESPERDEARATAWRDRLATEAWFKGEYRVYYQWGGRLALTGD